MDRSRLEVFRAEGLAGSEVTLSRAGEALRYRLLQRLGPGKTAAAWKALDSNQRVFAIKFSLREDYHTHSLDAEIDRANKLNSPLVAKITFVGVPTIADSGSEVSDFYAIVVEWIEGPTLEEFLKDRKNCIDPEAFIQFSRDLCEVLSVLRSNGLMHNDLHARNIIVSPSNDHLTGEITYRLVAIDTGQLKTEEKRRELIDKWENQISVLDALDRRPGDGLSISAAPIRSGSRVIYAVSIT
jgi:serine/threonine protein kinase